MKTREETLNARVAKGTGQSAFRCYQCGKCSAGCPVAGKSDLLPHQVLRLVQLDDETVYASLQPWLCVSCQTCMARCPQKLDLSKVMSFIRTEAIKRGTAPKAAKKITAFNEVFLQGVESDGRLNEAKLGGGYNMRTRSPFQNLSRLPGLVLRGKIRPPAGKINGIKEALQRARQK